MTDVAISVDNLSKQYHIAQVKRRKYRTMRDALIEAVSGPFRRASSILHGHAAGVSELYETIWALQNISFTIKPGEIVGIIGRNGAGKSTLLKILSRITEPTMGVADIYGRVGSLLEVGTGFHPELSGRENVFLNGAILGMKRREIERKFDEILDFSAVEKFIDTPIKHYSSGMRMRLAFAVAAHLEPEILIVDEVLAVGDAAFQRKCLNKIQDIGQQGRTVLFVSHSMVSVTRLCDRVILLKDGQLLEDGPAYSVVRHYLNAGLATTAMREWDDLHKAPGDEYIRLRGVRVRTEEGKTEAVVDIRLPVVLEVEYEIYQPGKRLMLYLTLRNEAGQDIFCTIDSDPEWQGRPRPAGHYVSSVVVPGNLLAEGTVFVAVGARTLEPTVKRFYTRETVVFQVVDRAEGDSARLDHGGKLGGIVRPLLPWSTDFSRNGTPPQPAELVQTCEL
jgi:lipopolysaccharide transport system ATP-binding protein